MGAAGRNAFRSAPIRVSARWYGARKSVWPGAAEPPEPDSAFTASARTRLAAILRPEAATAALRSWRSLYWSARLAEVVPIRAISGTATTIRPFARTDRSSHHRRSQRERPAAGKPELVPRDPTSSPDER